MEKLELKTMWKHERSTSRARDASKGAEREITLIDEMDKVSPIQDFYYEAVKAIDDACAEKANIELLEPSSLGIDKVRNEIQKA